MLWTKESNKKNALYVDVFSLKSSDRLNHMESLLELGALDNPYWGKDDEVAVDKRLDGNKNAFAKGDFRSALGIYNDSLCYAEPGSENVSLAYANRSACFFHLKKYKECLVDIELAKSCEDYPSRLTPKLDKRQADAMKLLQEDAQEPDDRLKVDFVPNENFPFMANVVQVEKNAKGNLILVAKEDIHVGKVFGVEKAFSTCLYSKYGWRCCICLNGDANLMPCMKCNVAMFCSKDCQSSSIHELECGLRCIKYTQENGLIMTGVRMIFKAIEIIPNVDELMAFVEDAVQGDPNEIPEALLDEKSKYRAFLKLPYFAFSATHNSVLEDTFCIYKMLMDVPTVKAMFKSKRHDRFLKQLIVQHMLITNNNSMRVRLLSVEPNPEKRRDICTHTSLMKRYFKHSCAPNVMWIDCNGHSVYTAIRPIKKGEQLCTTIMDLLMQPKEKRQKELWKNANFICDCTLCDGPPATPQQREQLLSDPLYKSGLGGGPEKCAAILQKYGHGPLCEEMKNVLNYYCHQLCLRYIGPANIRAWAEILCDSLSK